MRRILGAMVVGLVLSACSSHHPEATHQSKETSTSVPVTQTSACLRPASLTSGETIGAPRLGAIDFLSAETGVALSAKAIPCFVPGGGYYQQPQPVRLAVTTDGGLQWVTQGSAIPSSLTILYPVIEQVVAVSTSTAWALDDEGTLLETTNGGTTWTTQVLPTPVDQVAQVGNSLWALACPSPTGTLSCANPVLERVPLAGGTWAKLELPSVASKAVPTLNVASSQEVVLVFSPEPNVAGNLVYTTDGGGSWSVEAPPGGPGGLCMTYPQFSADSAGDWWLLCVGAVALGSSTQALMRSTDDGQTWTVAASHSSFMTPSPPGSLSGANPAALAAPSPTELWLAGFNSLTESSDGGVSWSVVPGVNPQGTSTGSFDVLSPQMAWLLAPETGLWTTSDGTTWHPVGAVTTY